MIYVTDIQLATRWQVSRNTIWRWARLGRIPSPIRLAANVTRWRLEEIEAYEARAEAQRA
ncbi:helix-turn-helix transcriptional regulator [Salinisphaera aquimarina]|uniref:Helix-turn-helix transcriptional regulator n=1 Tax=Salinisphaera aquimarina TaxID=2094031 RepID=A0ABV7ETZ5_9GAMM